MDITSCVISLLCNVKWTIYNKVKKVKVKKVWVNQGQIDECSFLLLSTHGRFDTQAFSFDKCLTLKLDLDNDFDTWPESEVNHSWLCLQYNSYYTEQIIIPKCMITAFNKCLTLKVVMTFDTDLDTEVDT